LPSPDLLLLRALKALGVVARFTSYRGHICPSPRTVTNADKPQETTAAKIR